MDDEGESRLQKFQRDVRASRRLLQEKRETVKTNCKLAHAFYRDHLRCGGKGRTPYKQIAEEVEIRFKPTRRFRDIEMDIIREAQEECYKDELEKLRNGKPVTRVSKLAKQNPFLTRDNTIMAQGRFRVEDARPLIVLPKNHPVTRLYIKHVHKHQLRHIGSLKSLISELKKTAFIPGMKQSADRVISDCYQCRVKFPRPFVQHMSELHESRIPKGLQRRERVSPFAFRQSISIDYFGPLSVKVGRGTPRADRFVMLAICQRSRCIHLELVYGGKTKYCLQALL